MEQSVSDIVDKISGNSQNDLIHYIALRRNILDLFEGLNWIGRGRYYLRGPRAQHYLSPEGRFAQNAIFNHNLWIIDERLNFTSYLSSDIALDGGMTEHPDLIAYDKRILFRGDNEPSNPVRRIFRVKKAATRRFVNPSSDEDPVQQIVRYVNNIRDGKLKTPEGKKMLVGDNTPFYGFVVCDLTAKVEKWLLRREKLQAHA